MPITQDRMIAILRIALAMRQRLAEARAQFIAQGQTDAAMRCDIDTSDIETLIREDEHFRATQRINEKRAMANYRRRLGLRHEEPSAREAFGTATRTKPQQYTQAEREALHAERMAATASRHSDKDYAQWNNGLGLEPYRGPLAGTERQPVPLRVSDNDPMFQPPGAKPPAAALASAPVGGTIDPDTTWSAGPSEELDPTTLRSGDDLF